VVVVGAWGYFLYQGVVDPLGGINSLWPLFGISNQLLAATALAVATTILIRSGRVRYAWTTILPLGWLLAVTMTAGWQKIFHDDPSIGFLAQAGRLSIDLTAGKIPAAKLAATRALIFNNRLDAAVTAAFMSLVVLIVLTSARRWVEALSRGPRSEIVPGERVVSVSEGRPDL
jgi:carbon starvation protein